MKKRGSALLSAGILVCMLAAGCGKTDAGNASQSVTETEASAPEASADNATETEKAEEQNGEPATEEKSEEKPEEKTEEQSGESVETEKKEEQSGESAGAEGSAAVSSEPGRSASLTDRAFTIDGVDLHVPCTQKDLESLGLVMVDDMFGFYQIYGWEGSNVDAQCIYSDIEMDPSPETPYPCVSFRMGFGKLGEQPDRKVIIDGCELGVMTLEEFDRKYPDPDNSSHQASTTDPSGAMDDIREFYLSENRYATLGFTFDQCGLLREITINLLYEEGF